ncbi:hypothetical protein OH77DRAFT_1424229 [Trametes cingulata]|nr:hypothetical protein OH77DRAFT_1424229 [Trametes cingulata]
MYILVSMYFDNHPSEHPFLQPTEVVRHPCLLPVVVSPTKALGYDMVCGALYTMYTGQLCDRSS